MRLAVCDDNTNFLARSKAQIESWSRARGYGTELRLFEKSGALYDLLQTGAAFDIFVLDIEMTRPDGLELARQVRDCLPKASIIFLTAYDSYAPLGYELGVLRYVPKAAMRQKLEEALDAAWEKQLQVKQAGDLFLTVQTGAGRYRLFYQDIVYVHYAGRRSSPPATAGRWRAGKGCKNCLTNCRTRALSRSTVPPLSIWNMWTGCKGTGHLTKTRSC